MNLNEWAIKWGVPFAAVEDLRQSLHPTLPAEGVQGGESETAIQTRVRLEAAAKGVKLWRNNVGATLTPDGGFVRYGLANDSKQMNALVKSSDLIGLRAVRIEARHVGHIFGQFVAREVKEGRWSYSGSKRELAQLRFLELVLSLGGDAAFANQEGTL